MSNPEVLILTGQSGSGKSTAMRALEDQGYLCVDNVPASLVESLIETIGRSGDAKRLALVMDVRQANLASELPSLVHRLRSAHRDVRVIYFEAREESLIRRYSETRRRHPLDRGDGLRSSIHREHEILAAAREIADDTVDTTELSPHDLRDRVTRNLAGAALGDDLRVGILSFGFKHGVPVEADIVLDVRFLPNPYFIPELREMCGLDEPVSRFVLSHDDANEFLDRADSLLGFLLPRYQREGKRYLTIGIGCTGGQHRSVAISRAIADRFESRGLDTDLRHRDTQQSPPSAPHSQGVAP